MTTEQAAYTKVHLVAFLFIIGIASFVVFSFSEVRSDYYEYVDVRETQNAADHVQADIQMQYALAPVDSVDEIDLTRPYPARSSNNLNRLIRLSKTSGL